MLKMFKNIKIYLENSNQKKTGIKIPENWYIDIRQGRVHSKENDQG